MQHREQEKEVHAALGADLERIAQAERVAAATRELAAAAGRAACEERTAELDFGGFSFVSARKGARVQGD